MTDSETATTILDALVKAEREPPPAALPILNGLVGLVQGDPGQPLEVEEARSAVFMAICEVAKALHRGQPAAHLWAPAIAATQKWKGLVR